MNGWFIIIFGALMLVYAIAGAAVSLSGWQANSPYVSTHDDPSPGPNALF